MAFLKHVRPLFVCLLMAVVAGPAWAAQSDTAGPVVIRVTVIDFQKIEKEAALYKSIREQVGQYNAKFRGIFQAEEDELRKADRELARQRAILSPEAYADERRKFEKRVVAFQRQGEGLKHSLEKSMALALHQANVAVKKIVDKFANEHQITLILMRDKLAFFDPRMDITPAILELLDKATPTIKVPEPEQPPQPQPQSQAPNAPAAGK